MDLCGGDGSINCRFFTAARLRFPIPAFTLFRCNATCIILLPSKRPITENGGFLIASVGARFDTQRVSGELEMGKLVKIGPNCGEACLKQCVSNGNGFTPEHPRRERNSPRYYERPWAANGASHDRSISKIYKDGKCIWKSLLIVGVSLEIGIETVPSKGQL